MHYRELQPRPESQSFIHCLWTLDTDDRSVQRIVPDGRSELIVNLAKPCEYFHEGAWQLQPAAFLAGQITGPLLIRPSGPAKILGARFHPQGAARVFDMAMDGIVDRIVPVDLACGSIEELESVLVNRAGPPDPLVDAAARRTMEGRGG